MQDNKKKNKTTIIIVVIIVIALILMCTCFGALAFFFLNPSNQSKIEDQYCRKWRANGAYPEENIGFCAPVTEEQWEFIKEYECENPEDYDETGDELYYICTKDEERDKRNVVKGFCMAWEEGGSIADEDLFNCQDGLWKTF